MQEKSIFNLLKNLKSTTTNETGRTFMAVGLGNPGKEYAGNRHNVGFMAVDYLMNELQFSGKKVKNKAIIIDGQYVGVRLYLVKPQTFMNLSGDSVNALLRFFKIPVSDLVILHDDIDLPFGTIRLRPAGGAGGQKGVASIIQKLGTQNFARIRIGVGRPPGRMDAADYVLKDFSKVEKDELPFVMDIIGKAFKDLIAYGIESAMNAYNGSGSKE